MTRRIKMTDAQSMMITTSVTGRPWDSISIIRHRLVTGATIHGTMDSTTTGPGIIQDILVIHFSTIPNIHIRTIRYMGGIGHIRTIRIRTRGIRAIMLIEDRGVPREIRARGEPALHAVNTTTMDVDRPQWEPEACHRDHPAHISFLAVEVIDRQPVPVSTPVASRNEAAEVVGGNRA